MNKNSPIFHNLHQRREEGQQDDKKKPQTRSSEVGNEKSMHNATESSTLSLGERQDEFRVTDVNLHISNENWTCM